MLDLVKDRDVLITKLKDEVKELSTQNFKLLERKKIEDLGKSSAEPKMKN